MGRIEYVYQSQPARRAKLKIKSVLYISPNTAITFYWSSESYSFKDIERSFVRSFDGNPLILQCTDEQNLYASKCKP